MFDTFETGVEGYFKFLFNRGLDRYNNLKNVTDYKVYIQRIREDGYATSLDYVKNLTNLVEKYNLTKYDKSEVAKMKYDKNNAPLVCMQTQSTCYKGTSKMEIKGILWHSTGANNPNLKRYVQPSDNAADKAEMLKILGTNTNKNDWNHITRQAGLNAWVGKLADGSVATVQTMPWNYKPWGCGSGSKGSCNNGWIQFEICEDDLNNKDYFEKVYNEAIELTAYLCKLYNIDPNSTVVYNNVKVPTILCHQDSYKLNLGSNHGDIYHWFKKYNKDMNSVRSDVSKLLNNTEIKEDKPAENTEELYRVRLSWENAKSQIGAYKVLDNAKKECKAGYSVYDSKGNVVYSNKDDSKKPLYVAKPTLRKGDKGDQVRYLQDDLNYVLNLDMKEKLIVDGSYGPLTFEKVKQWQKSTKVLEVDGIYGPKSYAQMKKYF